MRIVCSYYTKLAAIFYATVLYKSARRVDGDVMNAGHSGKKRSSQYITTIDQYFWPGGLPYLTKNNLYITNTAETEKETFLLYHTNNSMNEQKYAWAHIH